LKAGERGFREFVGFDVPTTATFAIFTGVGGQFLSSRLTESRAIESNGLARTRPPLRYSQFAAVNFFTPRTSWEDNDGQL
jgi:hypothetical protein